ncbi:MAG: M48 family metalloprotease [Candidatus Nanopelagicales bacterium]
MSPHGAVLVVLFVGVLALAVAALFIVPWRTLAAGSPAVPPDVARDFTAAEQARSRAYHRAARPTSLASMAVSLLWTLSLGLTTWGADWVSHAGSTLWLQVILGLRSLLLAGRLLTLPFAVAGRRLALRVGLAAGSWRTWWLDVLKGTLLSLALTLVAAGALLGLARWRPGSWWWWAAAGAAVVVVLLSFILPVVVEPLFLRFSPLPDGAVRQDLLDLARRDGVVVADVLVADASRRTTALNAYVSGFGPTRRVVLFDTLLEQAPPAQTRLVVAHELGHVVNRDVVVGTVFAAVGVALTVLLLSLALSWTWLLDRAGAAGPSDPAVLPLVLALGVLLGIVTAPAQSLVSRRVEARADVHALDLAAGSDPADAARTYARMHKRLAVTNLADLVPNPLRYLWFASHPSTARRIALIRSWASLRGATVPDLATATDASSDGTD